MQHTETQTYTQTHSYTLTGTKAYTHKDMQTYRHTKLVPKHIYTQKYTDIQTQTRHRHAYLYTDKKQTYKNLITEPHKHTLTLIESNIFRHTDIHTHVYRCIDTQKHIHTKIYAQRYTDKIDNDIYSTQTERHVH